MSSGPVTLVVARRPKPGSEAALEAWLEEIVAVAGRFPGHLGSLVVEPHPGQAEYVLIARYASQEHLQRWWDSAECAELLARGEALTRTMDIQTLTGMEGWFVAPERRAVPRPPGWKMWLVTWAVITPLVLLIGATLEPALGAWRQPWRTMATSAVLCALMTWAVMPLATRLLAGWLFGPVESPQPARGI
ncbi:MAG: antibiotic biosynthesis monooxygenase [Candidatus Sericytochromatia bacterium]|nr:antibiotic biosynthesis monooxygenase [Candidatus Tanganyikabacteria bacterium]